MRGGDLTQSSLFSYIGEEERVHKAHPLRKLRLLLDVLLKSISAEFATRSSHSSRPSIAPEMFSGPCGCKGWLEQLD